MNKKNISSCAAWGETSLICAEWNLRKPPDIPDYLIGEGRGEDEPGEEDGRRRVRPRRELERDQLVRDVVVLLRVGHRTERLKKIMEKIHRWRLELSLIIFTATASYHWFIL